MLCNKNKNNSINPFFIAFIIIFFIIVLLCFGCFNKIKKIIYLLKNKTNHSIIKESTKENISNLIEKEKSKYEDYEINMNLDGSTSIFRNENDISPSEKIKITRNFNMTPIANIVTTTTTRIITNEFKEIDTVITPHIVKIDKYKKNIKNYLSNHALKRIQVQLKSLTSFLQSNYINILFFNHFDCFLNLYIMIK